jgi:peptide/nickel transport system ATP-binding protein
MEYLMEIQNASKRYGKHGLSRQLEHNFAVRDVSLQIPAGASMGLIGESGSGKSTLGRMMAGLETPTSGDVFYAGCRVSALSFNKMRPYRRNIQMIFQNSSGMFDPTYTVGHGIDELIRNNERCDAKERERRKAEILVRVGLEPFHAERKSHEMSGGQRQRVNIARALVLRPKFVVCDEPVSSLDYSLRKQILTLLNDLRSEFGLTYLFITHDLNCVPYVCDRVVIMYCGRVMEQFELDKVSLEDAVHPYTMLLLSSMPVKNPAARRQKQPHNKLELEPQSESQEGCPFHPRCGHKTARCKKEEPQLRNIGNSHMASCHCL